MTEFGHTHSRVINGKRHVWDVKRLWPLVATLRVREVPIAAIHELDEDCWFCGGKLPTIRAIAEHCRRINAADLSLPLILNADGSLMDGGHRVARALLEGKAALPAVQFETMPSPDRIEDA